jgi:hypothetical protein
MDKHQAERALGIIREVIENTREDLVAHNWGLIWLVHAFTNAAGFASIGLWVERQNLPLLWYLVPLAILAPVNLAIVALLAERDRGVRSFVEWQIHGIWTTFIVFTIGGAAVILLAGAEARLFGPVVALTSGIGFSMMGVVFYRRFFIMAAVFLAIAFAAAALPAVQWYMLAAAWWCAMFVPGLFMFLEKRRRQQDERAARIL